LRSRHAYDANPRLADGGGDGSDRVIQAVHLATVAVQVMTLLKKSSRTRPRVRTSARGRASERPFFSALRSYLATFP
jgi:hypothetical protein